jgi:hypothetical protein
MNGGGHSFRVRRIQAMAYDAGDRLWKRHSLQVPIGPQPCRAGLCLATGPPGLALDWYSDPLIVTASLDNVCGKRLGSGAVGAQCGHGIASRATGRKSVNAPISSNGGSAKHSSRRPPI